NWPTPPSREHSGDAEVREQHHLAIIHAAGSPDTTRSHFDAQDYLESGTPGLKNTSDGWLDRTLQSEPGAGIPFRAIALGTSLRRILSGKASAIAVSKVGGLPTIHSETPWLREAHFRPTSYLPTNRVLTRPRPILQRGELACVV